jgi:hypothetical protein
MVKGLDNNWYWRSELNKAMNKQLAVWLEGVVPDLPDDVVQIKGDNYGIGVYWHERLKGDEQAVLSFLKHSSELPLIESGHANTAD